MASNFEKIESLFAENYNGDSILLPDKDLGKILAFTVANSPGKSWGTNLGISSGDFSGAGTITFDLILGGTRQNKTDIGAGETTTVKMEPVTLKWGKPFKYNHGFTAYDRERGLAATGALYSSKYNNQELLANGRYVMSNIQAQIVANKNAINTNLMADTVTPDQLIDLISAECIKVKTTKDDSIGIDGVAVQDILVQVPSNVFNKAVKAGRHGNFTQQAFQLGAYSTTTIDGYRGETNDYLPESCQAIIGTNFTGATADAIIAMNVEKLSPSNDIAVYNEYSHLDGGVYHKLLRGFIVSDKKATPTPAATTTSTPAVA